MTFILLKIVGIFLPLRLTDEELEIGDHAIHGNEVYPSDVPTLGGPHAPAWQPGGGGDGPRGGRRRVARRPTPSSSVAAPLGAGPPLGPLPACEVGAAPPLEEMAHLAVSR